jgi:sterol desaturase/sphingolipid hydroxylase (fatty acid hydroxylase superfamily)
MGLLTTEHGKSGYRADFILYGLAATALGSFLAFEGPRARWPETASFTLLGLAGWTLVEYGLHRFVLHGLQPFRRWHAEHHRRPQALIGTPTILSAALIAALVFMPALLLGDLWRACALTFGLMTGYFIYAITHHAVHHWRPRSEWARRRRRAHALHHGSVAPMARYGVTSAFWDVVFGTNGKGCAGGADALTAAQLEVWEDEGGALAGRGPQAHPYGRRRNGRL